MPTVGTKFEKGAFTEEQIKKLEQLSSSGFPWADTVLMLCYTGFRISEFLQLTAESYHSESGGYLVGGIKTDAGKNRVVPVHPKICRYLDAWLNKGGDTIICTSDGKPLASAKYRKYFNEVAKAIGSPLATPHWCRHTAASRMKLAGTDDLAVRRILDHSNKDVTEHYTHIDVDFLRIELCKVE